MLSRILRQDPTRIRYGCSTAKVQDQPGLHPRNCQLGLIETDDSLHSAYEYLQTEHIGCRCKVPVLVHRISISMRHRYIMRHEDPLHGWHMKSQNEIARIDGSTGRFNRPS